METTLLLNNIPQIVDYFYAFPDRDSIKINNNLYTKDSFVETIRPLLPIELQNITENQPLIEALYKDFAALQTLQEMVKNNIQEATSAKGENEQSVKTPPDSSIKEGGSPSSNSPETTHMRLKQEADKPTTQSTLTETGQPKDIKEDSTAEIQTAKSPTDAQNFSPSTQIPAQTQIFTSQVNPEPSIPTNFDQRASGSINSINTSIPIESTSFTLPRNTSIPSFSESEPIHLSTPPIVKNLASTAGIATQGFARNVLGQVGTFAGNLGWTGLRMGSVLGNASSKVLTNVSARSIKRTSNKALASGPFANKTHLMVFGAILSFIGISFFSILFSGDKQTQVPEEETTEQIAGGGTQTISTGFVGVNIPSLVTQPTAEIEQMLKYLSTACGTSVIRVFYTNDDITNGLERLKTLVQLAEANNVKLIITLANYGSDRTVDRGNNLIDIPLGGNPSGWYKDLYQGRYLKHVETTVTALKDSPAIYAWELANEPHCQGDSNCSESYANWVKATSAAIKAWDPNPKHLVSIGTQANDDINLGDSISGGEYEKNNSSPFISALTGHYYNGAIDGRPFNDDEFQKQKTKMLDALAIAKKLNKPFYIGEAGFLPNSDRAAFAKQEMDEFFNKGATGYLFWMYSNQASNPIDNDEFSFYENDSICTAMKEVSQKLVINVPAGGTKDIAVCTWYRGGDTIDGIKIANPSLVNIITDISNKVSVPPAIIAGIMRVETPSAMLSTSDYIINDYDAHCSLTGSLQQSFENCVSSGIAFGTMQFTPNTFTETFNRNQTEMNSLFGKTEATTTLDRQDNIAQPNTLRIYSIKDSIIAAAFKVRTDKQLINGDGPWDETTVKEIAARYYGRNADGTTNYPGWDGSIQNYGEDLWKSYNSCFSTVTTKVSCPIPNGTITCASYGTEQTSGGYSDICRVDSTGNGGHCNNNYLNYIQQQNMAGVCVASNPNTLPIEAYAIDVASPIAGTEQAVDLPLVNGKKLKWYYLSETPSASAGYIRRFESEPTPEGTWVIQFSHVVSNIPPFSVNQAVPADFPGGYLFNQGSNSHLHVTMGIKRVDSSIEWKFADRDLQMCVN